MIYNQNTAKSAKNERYYDAVEMDVRRTMKEACSAYKDETDKAISHFRHVQNRKRLASQLGRLLAASLVLFTLAACGMRVEWYGYSPDEFERNDRQVKTAQHYERMQK